MHLVERHLVGKELRAFLENAELGGAPEVIVAELIGREAVIAHPQIGQRAREGIGACEPARDDTRQVVHERKLVAGRNFRMRAQRLLDHGRA